MFTLKLYVVCADVEISGRKIGGGGGGGGAQDPFLVNLKLFKYTKGLG